MINLSISIELCVNAAYAGSAIMGRPWDLRRGCKPARAACLICRSRFNLNVGYCRRCITAALVRAATAAVSAIATHSLQPQGLVASDVVTERS
jgi:hypothetical protein